MEKNEAYKRAARRVKAKIEFYIHLAVSIAVNIFLIVVNLMTSPEEIWFIWPLMGWGIAVFFHFLSVFVFPGRSGITERMIEKEMKKNNYKEH